jgi:RNA polymerase sigma-70 factor (ECF subfamily)
VAVTVQIHELRAATQGDIGLEGDCFERRELRQNIQKSIQRLPYEYRVAIVLVDIKELSYQDAAQVLAIPVGTLKSRVARGRAMLVNWLKPTLVQ